MRAIIGSVIICLAFLGSILSPYLLIFTVPAFLVGATVKWISKDATKTKLQWTVIPLLLWFPCSALMMFIFEFIGQANAQKLDFIFPHDFRGTLTVIDSVPCGQNIVVKDGREQLLVPNTGVLFYQGEIRPGIIDHRYFQTLADGKLRYVGDHFTAGKIHPDRQKNPSREIIVGGGGMGSSITNYNGQKIRYTFLQMEVQSNASASLMGDTAFNTNLWTRVDSFLIGCIREKQ